MAKNRSKKSKTLKNEELLTSRLMTALLYTLFYGSFLLTASLAFPNAMVRASLYLAALATISAAVFAVVCWKRRGMVSVRVHSSSFLFSLCVSLVLSALLLFFFGKGGFWYAFFAPLGFCVFYFISIVYSALVRALGELAFVYFLMLFLFRLPLFSGLLLYRGLLACAQLLMGAALAVILYAVMRSSRGARFYGKVRILETGLLFLTFAVAVVLSVFFLADLGIWATFPLIFYFLYLVFITVRA